MQKKGPQFVIEEFIFDKPPSKQCHSSTIEETPNGLVASWFGGSHEKNKDVVIWLSRKVNDTWTEPISVARGILDEGNNCPTWNPVLYQVPKGPLILFYKVGQNPSDWWGMCKMSHDQGQSWSPAKKMPDNVIGPTKNKPILLRDGRLVCPSSTEDDRWRVHFEITKDFGKSWKITRPIGNSDEYNVIQPTLLKHRGNTLQMLARSKEGRIISSWSLDGGRTWGGLEPLDLPNPNSALDAISLEENLHILVYNHVKKSSNEWGGLRSPLNLAISNDGVSWRMNRALEKRAKECTNSHKFSSEEDLHKSDTNFYANEFSYPAIIQTDDGLVHITYTWKRKRIKHIAVDPSFFTKEKLFKALS